MREIQTERAADSKPRGLRSPIDQQVDTATSKPGFDPLEPLTRSVPEGSSAAVHALALNRVTDSQPSRAGNSLLQLQRRYGNRYVQRVLALAREGEGEATVSPEIESAIEGARGKGEALNPGVRLQMESAFGSNFSGVRIHTGAEAHSLNQAVNAVAFTTGSDIFFSQGTYNPASSSGRELLAHELTHVVQQGAAPAVGGQAQRVVQRFCPACEEEKGQNLQGKLAVGQPNDAHEQEADRMAKAVAHTPEPNATPDPTRSPSASGHAQLTAGYQPEGSEDSPLGGDGDNGTTDGQQPQVATGGVATSISTTTQTGPTWGNNGRFTWWINWVTNGTGGWIVQRIDNTYSGTLADGSPVTNASVGATPTYFEAWAVDGSGTITPANLDQWERPNLGALGSQTSFSMTGTVFWSSTDPATMGFTPHGVPDAGILLSTTAAPPGLGAPLLTRGAHGTWFSDGSPAMPGCFVS